MDSQSRLGLVMVLAVALSAQLLAAVGATRPIALDEPTPIATSTAVSGDIVLSGTVDDALRGPAHSIPAATVAVYLSVPRCFAAQAGTDGRYTLLIPALYAESVQLLQASAPGYYPLTQLVTAQELRAQPQRDLALIPWQYHACLPIILRRAELLPLPVPTGTALATATAMPTHTASPTMTEMPTLTPMPSETASPTLTPTVTQTPAPTWTRSATPGLTATPTETLAPTETPAQTETPTHTHTATATPANTPTTRPGLTVRGHVRQNTSTGPGLSNVSVFLSLASYPPSETATTNADGYYETDFIYIPGDEMTSVWPELSGYSFDPPRYYWRHWAGVENAVCDFVAYPVTPAPTHTPTSTSTQTLTETSVAIPTPTSTGTCTPTQTPIPTVTRSPTPSDTATPSATVAATPTPTRTPGAIVVTAWVSNPTPPQYSTVTVYGKITLGVVGIANVPMHAVWHYKTTTPTCDGVSGAGGVASCARYIGAATKGYRVDVDVQFTYEGRQYSAITGFTPQ